MKLYLVCTGDGMPIMWCLANPKLGEREVVAALLEHNHHLIHTGQILLADKEAYAKASLKKYRPIAARNDDKKVFSGLL
jgi:hypothetical protein